MTKSDPPFVPVLIVTFRNTLDVLSCLRSVARLQPGIIPVVYLCENGGLKAFGDLVGVLTGPDGGCVADGQEGRVAEACLSSVITLQRKQTDAEAHITIHVGCAVENLGYAGGINAWLRPLSALPNWNGAWILNPDTEPEPAALQSLIQYVEESGTGMVGSRLMSRAKPQLVHCRGLAWDFVRGSTRSVDMFVPASVCFPPEEQDRRLDSPSGASIYITRACLDQIGPMDERYFLYFEDLDWG